MSSLRELKRRIVATKNTSSVTRALQMVAASKIKVLQIEAGSSNNFISELKEIVASSVSGSDLSYESVFTENHKDKKILYLVFGPERGFCGMLTSTLSNKIFSEKSTVDYKSSDFVLIRKKMQKEFSKRGMKPISVFEDDKDLSTYEEASLIFDYILGIRKNYREIRLIYPEFINVMLSAAVEEKFLPLSPEDVKEFAGKKSTISKVEPSSKVILDSFLPLFLRNKIYNAILNAEASETGARMVAMKNATENANDLVDSLTLSFNKSRQQKITAEIAEIVAGTQVK